MLGEAVVTKACSKPEKDIIITLFGARQEFDLEIEITTGKVDS